MSKDKKFRETKEQLNEHVITSICNFLPLRDIKSVRFVNSLWNNGALPCLRKSSLITLGYYMESYSSQRLEQFMREMPDFESYENLKICIQRTDNEPLTSEHYHFALKFFTNFLKPKLKHLLFVCTIGTELELKLFNDVLHHFSHNLENLELSFWNCRAKERILKENLHFPKLTRFRDNNPDLWKHLSETEALDLYTNFYQIAPNLKTLVLRDLHPKYFVLKPIAQNTKLLPKLCSLDISVRMERSSDNYALLLAFPRKLAKFKFSAPYDCWRDEYKSVVTFLENNKNGLEHLELFELQQGWQLEFPAFPKLKTLKISIRNETEVMKHLSFGEIVYAVNFPTLNSLTIVRRHWDDVGICLKATFDSFFPKESDQVVNYLRFLQIPGECGGKSCGCERDWEQFRNVDVPKLFPAAKIFYD